MHTFKFRGTSLYVENKKYGEIRSGKFEVCSSDTPNSPVVQVKETNSPIAASPSLPTTSFYSGN